MGIRVLHCGLRTLFLLIINIIFQNPQATLHRFLQAKAQRKSFIPFLKMSCVDLPPLGRRAQLIIIAQ